jgi:hypothetical protein
MHFDEQNEGEFRIYAGAVESVHGDGYIAAVVVSRLRGAANAPREVWRDTSLAAGYKWPSPKEALNYAMAKGREVIRTETHCLAC